MNALKVKKIDIINYVFHMGSLPRENSLLANNILISICKLIVKYHAL